DEKTATDFYGRFTAEPYESGYGHTVGNSLRRILLSNLEGAAVTAVRIAGASHEYTAISGVKEDVINILLNLKNLRVKLDGPGPEVIYLMHNKQGPVAAGQIKGNDKVEVVSKDLVIAHLEPGGKLDIEIEISKGRGYVSSEETGKKQRPAGFIPMDALFSPVVKVHYDVEPARVGQKTDYDRLVLEVTTDGTILPKDAVNKAAELLKKSILIFTADGEKIIEESGDNTAETQRQDSKREDILSQSVDLIELSSRASNCLRAAKIHTVRDLVKKTDVELKNIKNMGAKSLEEIKNKLMDMGLSLGMKL
ncbi:MAG: DNA-directed RNA polymerase subunit alpha, partial [Elusimicrobia bacterium]|nr:DNA-directed RNA polymerase subunit alpha [Elusimicrobiota bacterium]